MQFCCIACRFNTVSEASTTKKENVPCSLRRVHSEQGAGTKGCTGDGQAFGMYRLKDHACPARDWGDEGCCLVSQHYFKTCFSVSYAVSCQLVAMEK